MSTRSSTPLDVVGPFSPAGAAPESASDSPFCAGHSIAYRLLLVGANRDLLARLSAFSEELGYEIDQATDAHQAASAIEARSHDFVIVEESLAGAGKGDLLRNLQDAAAGPLHALWLGDCSDARAITAALVAGFDDFLSSPLSHGELLSRLRAGARRLEFEHRWKRQAARDPLTKLPTGIAFAGRIRRHQDRAAGRRASSACILLEIDYFDRFVARFGTRLAGELFASVARELDSLSPAPAEWYRLRAPATGGGALTMGSQETFAALLLDHSLTEAAAWAERLAKSFAGREFSAAREPVRLTVSQGVAELGVADQDGGEMLAHAAIALRQARRLGRAMVVRYDASFAGHSSLPSDSAVFAGQRFVQATARDFMTPCTVVPGRSDAAAVAARRLHRGAHEMLPVVDGRGQLTGLVSADMEWVAREADPGQATGAKVADVMLKQPPQRDEQTTFPALLEFFTQSTHAWLVITKNGKPTGTIDRDTLASLTSPLARDEFQTVLPPSLASRYLFQGPLQDVAT